MAERNFCANPPKHIPDRVWKGKFAIVKIGKDIIKEPIQSVEHYLKLKALRDNTRIFNTGRFWK